MNISSSGRRLIDAVSIRKRMFNSFWHMLVSIKNFAFWHIHRCRSCHVLMELEVSMRNFYRVCSEFHSIQDSFSHFIVISYNVSFHRLSFPTSQLASSLLCVFCGFIDSPIVVQFQWWTMKFFLTLSRVVLHRQLSPATVQHKKNANMRLVAAELNLKAFLVDWKCWLTVKWNTKTFSISHIVMSTSCGRLKMTEEQQGLQCQFIWTVDSVTTQKSLINSIDRQWMMTVE